MSMAMAIAVYLPVQYRTNRWPCLLGAPSLVLPARRDECVVVTVITRNHNSLSVLMEILPFL